MFNIWGEKSSSPLIAVHGAWGCGFAIGPFIIRPYLGPDRTEASPSSNWTTMVPLLSNSTAMEGSRIEIAYFIVSTITMCVVAAFIIFYFCIHVPHGVKLHMKKKTSLLEVFSLATISSEKRTYAVLMLILFTLTYFANAGREVTFRTWLFSYAVE